MSFEVGAGIIYSTVEDMYKLDQALYTNKILSQKSLDPMFTPYKKTYGYGWEIKRSPDGKIVSHSGGGCNGFSAYFHRNLDHKICIVVLSNVQDMPVITIAENLERIVLRKNQAQPLKKSPEVVVNPAIYDKYVGDYSDRSGRWNFLVSKEKNRLFIEVNGIGRVFISCL